MKMIEKRTLSLDPLGLFSYTDAKHITDMIHDIHKKNCTAGYKGAIRYIIKDYYQKVYSKK